MNHIKITFVYATIYTEVILMIKNKFFHCPAQMQNFKTFDSGNMIRELGNE